MMSKKLDIADTVWAICINKRHRRDQKIKEHGTDTYNTLETDGSRWNEVFHVTYELSEREIKNYKIKLGHYTFAFGQQMLCVSIKPFRGRRMWTSANANTKKVILRRF